MSKLWTVLAALRRLFRCLRRRRKKKTPAMRAAMTRMGTMTAAAIAPPEMPLEESWEAEPALCPAIEPDVWVEEEWAAEAEAAAARDLEREAEALSDIKEDSACGQSKSLSQTEVEAAKDAEVSVIRRVTTVVETPVMVSSVPKPKATV